jgi:hypothetical protein
MKTSSRKLSAAQRAMIGRAVRESSNPPATVNEMVARYGITRAWCYRLARSHGDDYRHLWRLRPLARQACVDLADVGWSDGAIADVVKITPALVRRAIDAAVRERAERASGSERAA